MKNLLLFAAFIAGLFGLSQHTYAQAVTGVSLNKHTLTLSLWTSEQLVATVSPANAANKNVIWYSSNASVISVDSAGGNVTAERDGVAIIFVKTEDGAFVDSCVVTCQVNDAANFVTFAFSGENHGTNINNDGHTVGGFMPYGSDLTHLTVGSYQISPGAAVTPLPETVHDFSKPVAFDITAPDGKTKNTWFVSVQAMPDLSGAQRVDITFDPAPKGQIEDTVSWEENGIRFQLDYTSPTDTVGQPIAEVSKSLDRGLPAIGLFPARLNFTLLDTGKIIVASSMYIFENCGNGCTQVVFSGDTSKTWNIPGSTRSFYVFNLDSLKATGGSFSSFESEFSGITFWIVDKNVPVNRPPVANAGPDQTVYQGDSVHLDGTKSYDPDGDSLSFRWSSPAGITLTDTTGSEPSFKAPASEIGGTRTFAFVLVVNDGKADSKKDTVLITVKNKNHRPVAWFDVDSATVNSGDTATVSGRYSYDPDGDSLSFHWRAGAGITFLDSTAINAKVLTPAVKKDTTFLIYLKVDDGTLYSEPDTFYLTVKNKNRAPVAIVVPTDEIGNGITMYEKDTLWIDGSPSHDPDGDSISFNWIIPKGFIVSHADSAKVKVIAPEVKTSASFNASLIVSDGRLQSEAKFVIRVLNKNRAPVADAGVGFSMLSGKTDELDASGSADPDGDSLRITWIPPAGITLSDIHAVSPTFMAPEVTSEQVFTFKLVVSDGWLFSDTATVNVTVKPVAATLSVTATLNGDTIPYGQRHISLYRKNDVGNWILEEILSYNDNGETFYAVWAGSWMITVDPVGNNAGFVSTFSGDVAVWSGGNAISIAAGTDTHVNIHCIASGANLTGEGIIDGYIQRDTTSAGTVRNTISHADETRSGDVPAAGVTVYLYRSSDDLLLTSALTDKDGRYVFENLPFDAYYLIVQLPGYEPNTPWPVEVTENDTVVNNVNFLVEEGAQNITDVDNIREEGLKLYPNPVSSYLTVRLEEQKDEARLRIYDLTGRLMLSVPLHDRQTRLDLGRFQKGFYLLRIDNGNKTITRRIIKK